jgi:5-methylthioadenosine/S-adenosylhomocysteine deaminase
MEGRLLLKNCTVYRPDGHLREQMAVVVEGRQITRVAPDGEVPGRPGDWEVACRGRLLAPGLIDAHSHLVNGQLLPASAEALLGSPRARFEAQYRLDLLLTVPEIEALTAHALARALRSGVTFVVEHLHAPSLGAPALAVQARVAERLGIRLANSHATTSVGGDAEARAQLEANADHVRAFADHPLVKPMLGFHASFCVDDALLKPLGRLREQLKVGVLYHLAESELDLATTFARSGRRIVARLEQFGLLGPDDVAAHARAVDRIELEHLHRARSLVAISPRSALALERGAGGLEVVLGQERLSALGTSGVSSLWQELDAAFLALVQSARRGRMQDPDARLSQLLFSGPSELCARLYGLPSGSVEEGRLADLALYDLVPGPGPVSPLLLTQAPVAWTIVDGRVVMREGQLLGADGVALAAQASKALAALRERGAVRR